MEIKYFMRYKKGVPKNRYGGDGGKVGTKTMAPQRSVLHIPVNKYCGKKNP